MAENVGNEVARCPRCGSGTLIDIAFDSGTEAPDGSPMQEPESRQIETYSCGHEIVGSALATADQERLDVERRGSQETAAPLPGGTDNPSTG